jgi:hypothetical protein
VLIRILEGSDAAEFAEPEVGRKLIRDATARRILPPPRPHGRGLRSECLTRGSS